MNLDERTLKKLENNMLICLTDSIKLTYIVSSIIINSFLITILLLKNHKKVNILKINILIFWNIYIYILLN